MKKTLSVFAAAAMAASTLFALPRKAVDITVSGYTGASTLENFPVLVRISPERISGFSYADCAADGRDIAFADANGNALDREIDTWDTVGESLVWVRIPSFSSSTTFTMTYKDATVTTQPPCQTNGAVWAAAGYVGVWHFGEDYGTAFDSTTNALHGTVAATYDSTCIAANDAKVGRSRYVPGAANVSLPNFSHLNVGDTVSLSGWYKFDPSVTIANSASAYLFSCKTAWDSTADGWYVVFQWTTNSDTTKKTLGLNGAGKSVSKVTIDSIKSAWVHVTATFNGTAGAAYSNGALKGSPTLNAAAKNQTASVTPRMLQGSYAGFADEVRIRDAVNSADWVKAEYQTVAVDGFLTYGGAATLFESDSSLGVSQPFIAERGANYLSLQAEAFGVSASSTVKFLYGVSPDALTRTAVASSSVTADGDFTATLTRLAPGTAYYVKAVVEENGGNEASAESSVVCLQTADVREVPADYSPLEYIEGTGTQYIDTGYRPTPTTRTIIDFQFTARGSQYRVFGLEYSNLYYSMYQNGSGNWAYTCQDSSGSWTQISPAKTTDANRHVFDFNFADASDLRCLTIDGGAISSATGLVGTRSKVGSGSLSLGAAHTGATSFGNISKHRIYFCQMYEGGVVVRDFVPVKRKSDGVSGLYDFVEGEFHASAGTGAYVAGPGISLSASEVIANNALASFALSFDASATTRNLRAAWGPVHGGDAPADWLATSAVASVEAGATSATWAAPANWGSDTNLVVRFYFDGDPARWSNAIFWHNYAAPSVTDVLADGTGGDTLVVSGILASFPGDNCTLSIYTGDSPTTLDHAWAGNTVSTNGAFSFTLHEPDTTSARYLAPASTVYVSVQAVADGEVTRTEPVAITMSAAATFASSSTTISRRTVTFSGSFSDLGTAGAAVVRLYVGPQSAAEADLVAVEEPVTVTDTSAFSITHTFDDFETTYKWQFRAVSTAAGGTATAEARSSVATVKTLDTTTYTWKTSVTSGNWSDAANWTDNQSGDCLGYPQSAAASAVFPAGTDANVVFTEKLTIASLNLADGPVVTFSQGGASTNATKLTATTLTWHNNSGRGGSITLDGVAIASTSGDTLIDTARSLRLVNGANLHLYGLFGQQARNDVLVADGSYLSCNGTYFGGGTLTISNATFWTRGHDYVGRNVTGGHIVFQGDHPLFYHANKDNYFYSAIANANVQLDFLVPVGGYAAAPIQAISTQNYYMGNNKNSNGSCAITVNVPDESPANYADATVTTPLISWPKGINKTMVQTGHLPVCGLGAGTDDAFAWVDAAATYPTELRVTINGSSHSGELHVSGVPEAFGGSQLSPAYGFSALAANETRTCTAPADYVSVADGKRAICTGWKLYDVDAATLSRSLVDEGSGSSVNLVGAGNWQDLEWQWQVEYRVSATANGAGTVSPAEQWIVDGESATVTATPDTGATFYKWTNDVPASVSAYAQTISFSVSGPVSLYANFGGILYVRTAAEGGSDGGDGTAAHPLLSVEAAFTAAQAAGSDISAIDIGAGDFPVSAELILDKPVVVRGAGLADTRIVKSAATSRILTVNHAEASVSDLTMTGSRYNVRGNLNGSAVLIGSSGGTIARCRITDCQAKNYFQHGTVAVTGANGLLLDCVIDGNSVAHAEQGEWGGGVYLASGRVSGCVITNNTAHIGLGVYMTAGTVENCLIAKNKAPRQSNGMTKADGYGGVYMTGGTLLHCTVVGNKPGAEATGGGVYVNGTTAKVVNCIIRGNTAADAGAGFPNIACSTAAAYNNVIRCAIPANVGVCTVTAAPLFVDEAGDDYRLLPSSPCVDAATNGVATLISATDVSGGARVVGAAADIGCHESLAVGFDCALSIAADRVLPGTADALAATVRAGDSTAPYAYAWTLTGPETVTSTDASLAAPATPGLYTVALSVTDALGATASATVADALFVAPRTNYVAAVAPSGSAFPYDTPEKAAGSLADAYAASAAGTTILLGHGTHTLPKVLYVTRAVRIEGEGWGNTTITVASSATSDDARCLYVNDPDAVVTGVTITGGHPNFRGMKSELYANGAGLLIGLRGGTVSWCRITGNAAKNFFIRGGGAALVGNKAVLSHCLVDGNRTHTSSSDEYAGGIFASRGLVENCLVTNNTSVQYGGGIAIHGSAKIRNCTVAFNKAATKGGGLFWFDGSGREIRNCLFAFNTVTGSSDTSVGLPEWSMGSINATQYANISNSTFNCGFVGAVATGVDSRTMLDPFVDSAAGDLHILSTSDAAEAGTTYEGIAAVDLDGNARVSGAAPDMGCFEADMGQFSCGFSASAGELFEDQPLTLTPSILNAPAGVTFTYLWTLTDHLGNVTTLTDEEPVTTLPGGLYTIVLTATPSSGAPATALRENSLLVAARTNYVSAVENPSIAFPYRTAATAATNLLDVLPYTISGSTVILLEGRHIISSEVVLDKAITLRGLGRDVTTLDRNRGNTRALLINHEHAIVERMTITGARSAVRDGVGGGVRIASNGGTLRDCRVTGNVSQNYYQYGGGVAVTGAKGLVDRCVIDGNANTYREQLEYGGGVYATAGVIQNCLVTDNASYFGGGAAVTGSGVIRNCTIVRNRSIFNNNGTGTSYGEGGGICYISGGTVQNCIFAENTCVSATGNPEWVRKDGSSTATFSHCAWPEGVTLNATTGANALSVADFRFRNANAGDYRIRRDSPCHDAGLYAAWMADAFDLEGLPRVDNRQFVDIGCHETRYAEARTMLILR